jgi:hypothetical protein
LGDVALIVFFASLAVGFIALAVLVWSALQIYRTARYAQKDAEVWISRFGERGSGMQDSVQSMNECAANIAALGRDIQERVEDIADIWEELRSHGAIRTASFIGRHRRR